MTRFTGADLTEAVYEMHADQTAHCTCEHCEAHRAAAAENEDLQELLGNKQYRPHVEPPNC